MYVYTTSYIYVNFYVHQYIIHMQRMIPWGAENRRESQKGQKTNEK